jgi:hypothetical protein
MAVTGTIKPWVLLGAVAASSVAIATSAQKPQPPTAATAEINLTATSANVSQSGSPIKIRILRWSTDEERSPLLAALDPAAVSAPAGAASNQSPPASGRGRAARGGRGGRRGGRGDPAAASTPIAALTAAIGSAPTVGYIWTNDITGYSIKYAYRASTPDGGERIILATDRRLGAYTGAWTPVAPAVMDYEFTLVEMRLDAKGLGEGKTSLTTKVILDNEARTVALEDYAATPAILQNVKR